MRFYDLKGAIPWPHVVLEQNINLTTALWLTVKFLGSLSTHRIISLALAGLKLVCQSCSFSSLRSHLCSLTQQTMWRSVELRCGHCPPGNSRRSSSLNNLALSLRDRSHHFDKAAEDGPVIILNASQYGCDALIIHSTEDPVHVSLDTTQAEVSEFSSEFQSLAEVFGSSNRRNTLVRILRKLWDRRSTYSPIPREVQSSPSLAYLVVSHC
ncbi:hypothetical protein DFJ58DRAFT_750509 [Suillus subalutaceus]|uniref:uncharacterized protein n=1 Tax=Suillus subalutaceus TaxID=48586 RepID=UPI001B85D2B2|nr:uncharacterized protein DFJ58DRAFT_750509 [Suillus subalutaceus]KAG1830965.1 hypothetical protein DFJ58DRAFT_750509 [Suillus subalutaceus]